MNNEEKKYIKLTPFKMQVLQSFPFIDADFDALTNYELLCKVVDYLNKTIDNVDVLNDEIEEYIGKFNELKEYVDNYFDNLNVQEEINNKLDEMATDGTFYNLINNELFTDINNNIVQNSEDISTLNQEMLDAVKTTDTNIVGMSMLTQEVREAFTGGSTAVVGIDSVNTDNVSDNAITIYKLDDLLEVNFSKIFTNVDFGNAVTGHYKYISDNAIADGANTDFNYYEVELDNNSIYEFSGFNNFSANGIIIFNPSDNSIINYTPIANNSNRYENVSLIFKTNISGLKAYINSNKYNGTTIGYEKIYNTFLSKLSLVSIEKNLNKLTEIEGYLPDLRETTASIDTIKMSLYADGHTNVYKISKGTKYLISGANIYNYCGAVILNEKMQVAYKSSNTNVGGTPDSFTYEFTATNDGYVYLLDWLYNTTHIISTINIVEPINKYKSKKWSLIGDSLTDPNVNESVKKYYSYIQDDLGINIQNLGQSGCGYKRKFNDGNNFVEQSLLLDNDVDIVTIFGSFNDQHYFDVMGTVNDNTTDTLLGSVNVTINNIINNHPNAKIGIIIPTPWSGINPKNLSSNASTYLDGIRTIAKNNSIPILDLFYESNLYPWVASFRQLYFVNNDGVHPNTDGNKRFAYQIEEFIKRLI